MSRLEAFSKRTAVLACLCSFLVLEVKTQTPILSVGTFTSSSDPQCIKHGTDRVTLQAIVNLNGAKASQWLTNGVEFLSPDDLLLCTASLKECAPRDAAGCYCSQKNGFLYTVVINLKAEHRFSQESISVKMSNTDGTDSVTSSGTVYPHVSGSAKVTVKHGSITSLITSSSTTLGIPRDDPRLRFKVEGLSRPYTVTYEVMGGDPVQLSGQEMVTITLALTDTQVTVRYQEGQHCKRQTSFDFSIYIIWNEAPKTNIDDFEKATCVQNAGSPITLDASVDFIDGEFSHWKPFVYFQSSIGEVCQANLAECPPADTDDADCYCYEKVGAKFRLKMNISPSLSFSGKHVYMEMFSVDNTMVYTGAGSVKYPVVTDNVEVSMTYKNDKEQERYSPPTKYSVLSRPLDNQYITFKVTGLKEPFSLVYMKPTQPIRVQVFENQSSITVPVDEAAKRIQLSYEEDVQCKRKDSFYFTISDDSSSDDEDLSTGAIVGIAFGGVFFLIAVIFLIVVSCMVCYARKGKKNYRNMESPLETSSTEETPKEGAAFAETSEEAPPPARCQAEKNVMLSAATRPPNMNNAVQSSPSTRSVPVSNIGRPDSAKSPLTNNVVRSNSAVPVYIDEVETKLNKPSENLDKPGQPSPVRAKNVYNTLYDHTPILSGPYVSIINTNKAPMY